MLIGVSVAIIVDQVPAIVRRANTDLVCLVGSADAADLDKAGVAVHKTAAATIRAVVPIVLVGLQRAQMIAVPARAEFMDSVWLAKAVAVAAAGITCVAEITLALPKATAAAPNSLSSAQLD